MLEIKQKTTLTAKTIIDGVEICGYQAQIDSENPENLVISEYKINKDAYKENRETCRKDKAAFEDHAYKIQDEMLAKMHE